MKLLHLVERGRPRSIVLDKSRRGRRGSSGSGSSGGLVAAVPSRFAGAAAASTAAGMKATGPSGAQPQPVAVLGYDTSGDGHVDAFDTNGDGRLDTTAAQHQPPEAKVRHSQCSWAVVRLHLVVL